MNIFETLLCNKHTLVQHFMDHQFVMIFMLLIFTAGEVLTRGFSTLLYVTPSNVFQMSINNHKRVKNRFLFFLPL